MGQINTKHEFITVSKYGMITLMRYTLLISFEISDIKSKNSSSNSLILKSGEIYVLSNYELFNDAYINYYIKNFYCNQNMII